MSSKNGRQPKGVFGIVSIEAPRGLQMELVPQAQPPRALNREQMRILAEFERQTFIIQAQGEKDRFGASVIGEIREHVSDVFQDTVTSIAERQREVHGEDYEAYIVEFNRVNVQSLAKNELGVAEISAVNVAAVVHKSLDLPPLPPLPPPPPPSFWKRIFG